jgi:hypothetical protein
MRRSTRWPRSRNHSATAVATKALFSRTRPAPGAEALLQELADLAATLSNQAHHTDVCLGGLGDLAEQGGLAHAGAGEQAEALALSHGGQAVQDADPEGERSCDAGPGHGVRRLSVHGPAFPSGEGWAAVQRPPEAVQDPPQHGLAAPEAQGLARGHDEAIRACVLQGPERQEHGVLAAKAHDLGLDEDLLAAPDLHELTDTNARSAGAQHRAHGLHQRTGAFWPGRQAGRPGQGLVEEIQGRSRAHGGEPSGDVGPGSPGAAACTSARSREARSTWTEPSTWAPSAST